VTRIRDKIEPNDFQLLVAAINQVDEPAIERAVEKIARTVQSTKPQPIRRATHRKDSHHV
jgi:hypothetical protein